MKAQEVLALSSSCQDNRIRDIYSSQSFIWNLCVFSFPLSPRSYSSCLLTIWAALSQSCSSARFHRLSILFVMSSSPSVSLHHFLSLSLRHTLRQSTFISVTVHVHLMAITGFIPPLSCAVAPSSPTCEWKTVMAYVCCMRGFTPHYGVIEHASFSSFALAPYLPFLASVIRFRGNYSSHYRPLHWTFGFRLFSVFLKQNMLSISVL